MTLALSIGIALVVSTIAYLGLAMLLLRHVERRHPQTWRDIGSPSLANFHIVNSMRSFAFVFFGGALKHWEDRTLRYCLISVWISCCLAITMLIAAKALEPGG